MIRTTRKLRLEEIARRYEYVGPLDRRQKRKARAEVEGGVVEVITFRVKRAWFESTCGGSDCCPNGWFLESESETFVRFDSWHYFRIFQPVWGPRFGALVGGYFPGTDVTIERWPETKRVISAAAVGAGIPIETWLPSALSALPNQWNQCLIFQAEDLPDRLRRELHDGPTALANEQPPHNGSTRDHRRPNGPEGAAASSDWVTGLTCGAIAVFGVASLLVGGFTILSWILGWLFDAIR
jgi:hypothetical protein